MEQGGLQQRVGLLGVVTLGAGVAIGVSIFTVLQPAAQLAGSGLLVAMVLAALPMVVFALVYAHLASVAPVSGASYEWPRRFLHPAAGFLITWCRILSNVGALTIYSKVLVQYLGMVVALPVVPVMAVAITAIFALNYFGVGLAARVQNALMLGLLLVLGAFVVLGFPHVAAERIGSPFSTDASGIVGCVVLMISLFLGIESAVEIGEEVRDGKRTIPRGIALAILVTMLAYAAVAATALGLVGPAALAASPAPLLTAAQVPFGALAPPIIVIAATASLLKSMNAGALVFSRSLFAMARGGTLWSGLAVIDPRSGVPTRAVVAAWACAMTGLLLPSNLIFLLLAVNIPTMIKYGACSLAAVQVANRHPELQGERALLRPGVLRVLGWLGVLAAAALVLAGIGADWRPHLLVAAWLLLGALYYAFRVRKPQGADAAG